MFCFHVFTAGLAVAKSDINPFRGLVSPARSLFLFFLVFILVSVNFFCRILYLVYVHRSLSLSFLSLSSYLSLSLSLFLHSPHTHHPSLLLALHLSSRIPSIRLHSPKEVGEIASKMLGARLITKQTGAEGRPCNHVLVSERLYLRRETYFSLMLDRTSKGPVMVVR
jgi:hypothetical protein